MPRKHSCAVNDARAQHNVPLPSAESVLNMINAASLLKGFKGVRTMRVTSQW